MEMAVGLEELRLQYGTPDSRFLISPLGLDIKALIRAMRQAETNREPLALIGIAGGLIHLLDTCEKEEIRFDLPDGSRICDVGRERSQFGGYSDDEYFRKCGDVLGVEKGLCVSLLWTCENTTNYFDNVLKNHLSGIKKDRCKEIPPWARITVVDTSHFERVPKGETGLLRYYDLTNRILGIAVQTDMLGFETADGFQIAGRWNRQLGEIEVDCAAGHPGGRVVTKVFGYLMRRKISKVGKIYSRLT
jgi:hypothetical protein